MSFGQGEMTDGFRCGPDGPETSLPVWLAARFADYLCHRAASIETRSGWRESLLHLLQFGEMVR